MVKAKITNGAVRSPYWEKDRVEKSKKIIDSLSSLNSNEREVLFNKFLDERVKVKGVGKNEKLEFCKEKSKSSKGDDDSGDDDGADGGDGDSDSKKYRKTFRCRSYGMHVTKETSSILRTINDDVRYIYNKVVTYLKGEKNKIGLIKKREIRRFFTTKLNNPDQTDPFILRSMERTPHKIREEAVYEAIRAHNLSLITKTRKNPEHKSCIQDLIRFRRELSAIVKSLENRKEGKSRLEDRKKECEKTIESLQESLKDIPYEIEKTSNVKFRLKKSPYATFTIQVEGIRKFEDGLMTIYPRVLKDPIKVKGLKEIPKHAFKIRWHRRTNSYRLIVPEKIEVIPKSDRKNNRMVVIDPGIRTFLTCLDFDDTFEKNKDGIYEIGDDWYDGSEIEKRVNRIKKYANISLRGKSQKEYKRLLILKRSVELDRKKILNIMKENHNIAAKTITDNYDIIILPKLKTKSIISKEGFLDKKTKNKASILSHCRFHQLLSWKAATLGKVVVDQDESYTTKTCYQCGFLTDIGGNKVYKCSNDKCKNICGRDAQSCFSILTRFMGDFQRSL
jgi:transposase